MNQSVSYIYQLECKIKVYKEKAEKFDRCLANPNEVMQWSGNTIRKYHLQIENNKLLEQENKQLKEDYDKLDKLHEKMTLKKHEYHQLNLNLKQKLEKIKKFKDNPNREQSVRMALDKILDSQEKE